MTAHQPSLGIPGVPEPPGASWIPLIIDFGPSAHVHGAMWWPWNMAWRTEYLPRGVQVLTITTARRGCALCEEWKTVLGWPKDVPKPENAGPGPLFSTENLETTPAPREIPPPRRDAEVSTETGAKTPNSDPFNDF